MIEMAHYIVNVKKEIKLPTFLDHWISKDISKLDTVLVITRRIRKITDMERVIFAIDEKSLPEGVDVQAIVLRRKLSYFGNDDSVTALLQHMGKESLWCKVIEVLWHGFDETTSREPFSLWKGVDPAFKDLNAGLTDIDPKRLTANAALQHPWFKDVTD
ncbi:uncharacterized protein GIQ15_02261 [Arthroderma uncinatum]|uniref:uncharacterized protein n=1 Tax=Arthroderma uncinatum TaxID=74035 RepID=UPI00144AF2D2|nr:uncharacterized protein GIQ15_02261 [Arthroderma uncinatum]KAF3482937.1 hypothetical protein GIQ15_02261 [Arthroderma uncinatum]